MSLPSSPMAPPQHNLKNHTSTFPVNKKGEKFDESIYNMPKRSKYNECTTACSWISQ